MTKKRIMLVDDDADDRLIFTEFFKDLGKDNFELASAEDGQEAISLLSTIFDDQLPNLIILDQNMPRMSGKETLSYLKDSQRYKMIPVIVYSTHNDMLLVDECLKLGAEMVISKPDSYDDFKQMVQNFYEMI